MVRPFVPFSETDERKNLIALMSVSSDPGSYGKLRVLNIKSPEQIDGPALVDSNIKRKYASDFTLQSQTGSKVRLGDLQAVPIGNSILWVRPWYVQAEQTPVPQLVYVTMAYGDNIVRARTLEGALKLAFPDAKINFSSVVGPITSVGPTTPAPGQGGGRDGHRRWHLHDRALRPALPPRSATCSTGPTSSTPTPTRPCARIRPTSPPTTTTSRRPSTLVTQAEKLAGGPVSTAPPSTSSSETAPTDTATST